MSNPISKWFKLPTLAERLRAQGIRDDVVQAAERTAFGRQSDRGIPAMAALLNDDEGVIQLVEARYAGATGLLVLTTRRLLFAPSAARSHIRDRRRHCRTSCRSPPGSTVGWGSSR